MKTSPQKPIVGFLLLMLSISTAMADGWYRMRHVASGLYLTFPASASDNPTLTANGSSVRFVQSAEGAVIQTADGPYLSANSNGWSINTVSTKSSAMSVSVNPLSDGRVTLRYRNGTGFGTDNTSAGSKIYYNKSRTATNSYWQLEAVDTSDAPAETSADAPLQYFYATLADQGAITLSVAGDYHLYSSSGLLSGTTVDLSNESAWIIADHVRPSEFISSYLDKISINGAKAVLNNNVRVAIYKDGCAVIPHPSTFKPFTGYHEAQLQGQSVALGLGENRSLGNDANEISSFVLRRGYMATIATNSDGTGYSRVYVADHADIIVNQLPTASNDRISSVVIKRWNYCNKKGWGDTGNNQNEARTVRANWSYSWSAGYNSTNDTEYVPHKSHVYWPSWSEINSKSASTHVLGYNEPEHSEQHSDDCGTTISEWSAFQHSSEFLSSGMRIGSASPTDASWLTNYIGYCDGYARRCDFVAVHAYWTGDIASWKSQLASIYSATKRPIWITEMEYGASWLTPGYTSTDAAKAKYQQIFDLLETLDYVEVFVPYNDDLWYNRMIYEEGGVTPAGQIFRDYDSDFAYKARQQFEPLWWQPAASALTLKAKLSTDGSAVVLTSTNPNLDLTTAFYLEKYEASTGTWRIIETLAQRPEFDNPQHQFTLSIDGEDPIDIDNDQFRLRAVLNNGKEVTSDATSLTLVQNPHIITDSKSAVSSWTCTRSAQNGFTQGTGNTYFEAWNATARDMHFNYYQDIAELPAGYYSLSALCFNSANGVADDAVNGAVGLYARVRDVDYFVPVTTESTIADSLRLTLPYIYVAEGDTLRVGIRNIGPMNARWAGADDFSLTYLGRPSLTLHAQANAWAQEEAAQALSATQIPLVGHQLYTAVNSASNTANSFRRMAAALDVARKASHFVRSDSDELAYDASALIINADCQRADSYGWLASNVGFSANEAWDGTTAGNSYFNYWSGSTWPSTLSQTLEGMPAGNYVLTALVRCSTAANLRLSLQTDGKESASTTVAGNGTVAVAGSPHPLGWMESDPISCTLEPGQRLTLLLQASASGSAWWSADRFRLTYHVDPAAVGIQTVDSGSLQDDASAPTYNLSGQRVGADYRGIVIRGGRKYLQR